MAVTSTPRTFAVPLGIVPVLGATCANPECQFHESLHTIDAREALRTARELGWQLKGDVAVCPLCAAATAGKVGGR